MSQGQTDERENERKNKWIKIRRDIHKDRNVLETTQHIKDGGCRRIE